MNKFDAERQRFHRRLNSPDWLSETSYRRNSGIYPLVCYVNTIIGACLSENYEIAALFIARAAEHMKSVQPAEREEAYYALAAAYFSHVIHHIRSSAPQVTFDIDRIPSVLFVVHQPPELDALPPSGDRDLYFWRTS